MKRARGDGSISQRKNGKFWARLPVDGEMKSLGVHATYRDAEIALHEALALRAAAPGGSASTVTFAIFGRRVLDMREDEGVRGIDAERRTWSKHLERCAFADKSVADVTPLDIANLSRSMVKKRADDHRGDRKLSRETVQRVLTLARSIFKEAVSRDMRSTNPCVGIEVKGAHDTGDEKWDWLRGDEQRTLLACELVPLWFRTMVRVAWGTGLRQGEMWNLELKDVHLARGATCACGSVNCIALKDHGPHLHVRYGAPGHKPPKNGKVRRTILFGEGLAGMTAWLDLLPGYLRGPNEHRLAFPSAMGHRRQVGAPERSGPRKADGTQDRIEILPEALRLAGISREVRWHDLRHTCASSLISGTWGRSWTLIAVRDQLGHKNIKTTERYAHLCADALRDEGAATPGHGTYMGQGNGTGGVQVAAITQEQCEGGDLNPHASYGSGETLELPGLGSTPTNSVPSQTFEEWLATMGKEGQAG